ncbi:diaminopimelate epimerase [Microvirga rosea]|uniref:diaminopimelate epimerase n=1 Tax=Microvirga rosea TaxID=2715425 RepID=UPI001D0AC3E5|nr:diaminopimelate epimerase [Microvirga rosea]MCB8820533.1 diaminopimelate epimerase [Microvirga rosea]
MFNLGLETDRLPLSMQYSDVLSILPSGRPFLKMHGLGNDFVVVDGREQAFRPRPEEIRWICDRHVGVGGDQLLVIEPSAAGADAWMRIYNVDGAEAQTCLNATRCVAWLLLNESGGDRLVLETLGGMIEAARTHDHAVALRLPAPKWDCWSIPLALETDTLALDLASGPLQQPTAVNVGNPHLVFFVASRDEIDVARWAPAIQNDPMLPEGANVGVAEMASPDVIRLVVWERPGILTRACGSGACAAVLAARRRGLTQHHRVMVDMPGGQLHVEVHDDESLTLTGTATVAFSGRLPVDLTTA